MILGISGSGRKGRMTEKAVKAVLEASNEPYEYLSLADYDVKGCTGCTGCAGSNICVIQDDFIEISEKIKKADAIVFGAPNYYGMMNGMSHCFWERWFSFRHRDAFTMSGKLAVAVVTGYRSNIIDDPVFLQLSRFITSNKLVLANSLAVPGFSQCFTCGHGQDCATGNIVTTHGFLEEVLPCHWPKEFEALEEVKFGAKRVGKMLGDMIRGKRQ